MAGVRVLVVGGAGYIGTHMVLALLEAGHEVIVLDDLSQGNLDLLPGGEFVRGDLGDRGLLEGLFGRRRVDAVMHFAAHAQVGESVREPLKYWDNNVARTVGLLSAMVKQGISRFLFSSSAAVYGEPERVPIAESHPCRPTNPYGRTKRAVEQLLAECDEAYGLRSMCLRYFNAAGADPAGRLGERHRPETHLIPRVLEAAEGQSDPVRIYGTTYPTPDGTCIRDFVHVSDLVQAHLLALEALLDGSQSAIYNLGSGRGRSVREVVALARRVTGRPIEAVEVGPRPGDPAVLVAGSDRVRAELGWRPQWDDLEAILETAWAWRLKEASRPGRPRDGLRPGAG